MKLFYVQVPYSHWLATIPRKACAKRVGKQTWYTNIGWQFFQPKFSMQRRRFWRPLLHSGKTACICDSEYSSFRLFVTCHDEEVREKSDRQCLCHHMEPTRSRDSVFRTKFGCERSISLSLKETGLWNKSIVFPVVMTRYHAGFQGW